MVNFLVVRGAQILILSNCDLKNLRLLHEQYPFFLGDKEPNHEEICTMSTDGDSDNTTSDKDNFGSTTNTHTVNAESASNTHTVKCQSVSVETMSGDDHTPSSGVSHTTTPLNRPRTLNDDRQVLSKTIEVSIDETAPHDAEEEAAFRILEAIGDEYIYSITETDETLDDEGVLDKHEITLQEEEELIKQKSEFERMFINKYREVFSESLSPIKFLNSEPIKILLSDVRKEWNSRLYCYKPHSIPFNIRKKVRTLIDK